MIRILHIVGSMQRGGIETFLMNIYRKIDKSKMQFDFLVHTDSECDYDKEIKKLGGRIYNVSPRREGIIKNKKQLNKFFTIHKEYKIIHQHVSSLSYIEPIKVARNHGVPVRIVHSHNTSEGGSSIRNYIHKCIHKYNRVFIRFYATHYFACSVIAAKWLYPKSIYKSKSYKVINNAIDTEKFIFNKELRHMKRKELGVQNKIVIGHIGRFVYQKNHDFLIDIFQSIHDINEDSILLLVGDGNQRPVIENKVKMLGLTDCVIFAGVCSDIPEQLQAMDIFVFPSHFEGLGIVAIEAQASGLQCLVANAIPKEAQITNLLQYESLLADSEKWANKAIKLTQSTVRKDMHSQVKMAGYDIKENAKWLEEFYIEIGR